MGLHRELLNQENFEPHRLMFYYGQHYQIARNMILKGKHFQWKQIPQENGI